MLQRRQYPALPTQPLHHRLGIHAAFDQLDGDALAELAIRPYRQINHGHSAAPDFVLNAVGAHHPARRQVVSHNVRGAGLQRVDQRRRLAGVVLQQGQHLLPQAAVPTAAPLEKLLPFPRRHLGGLQKQRLDLGPSNFG